MDGKGKPNESMIHILQEREKELNCMYEVDELLNNHRLSLPEIFGHVVSIIPSGWQFPELCQARISFENGTYHTKGFQASPYSISSSIKTNEKVVGTLEVVYIREVPKSGDGYFLDKEYKLIKMIADRIGQTILNRRMGEVIREWDTVKSASSEDKSSHAEWTVIVDFLYRTDHDMLLRVCRKMMNYLSGKGVRGASELLQSFSPKSCNVPIESNFPCVKNSIEHISGISNRTFKLASGFLSDSEITVRLRAWIQEEKVGFLIKAVDRIGASIRDIIEAVKRYRDVTDSNDFVFSPAERWLKVELIRRFLSDRLDYIDIAKQYIEIQDFYDIVDQVIFPMGSHGKLGGKSAGLFLAQQILKKESESLPALRSINVPKTWYITSDELTNFLHYNNLEILHEQKYKDLFEMRIDYPGVVQLMKNSRFSPDTIQGLAMALDDFGDSPLIVRSSSLLEDQMGSAFSGKHKSLFLANQGTKQKKLEALIDAIIEVYASLFSPDSIQYRAERKLLDYHEEMGIMIQEVVGTRVGPYFMPLFAGVAFSNNEFRWSPRIKREDGLVRIVPGLGTRAVDRLSDDFPVLASPGQSGLRVNTSPEEIMRYSPKKIDVINLENNSFETLELSAVLKKYGESIPDIHRILSVFRNDLISKPTLFDIDYNKDELAVTFEGLISDTPFMRQMDLLLKTLKNSMGVPIDIEFASDGTNFYLLQCRPQSSNEDNTPGPIPKDVLEKDIIFSANRYISNGWIQNISHIVYIDPEGYNGLEDLEDLLRVGRAVGQLNSLLPKGQFILVGPGRWGSRGDVKMGVQVSYADINNTAALIEVARKKSGYVPELSFGTHFFQDLVESNIRYLPLYPDDEGVYFNEIFLKKQESILVEILPQFSDLADIIRVIDVPRCAEGNVLQIAMNAELEEALAFLAMPYSQVGSSPRSAEYREPKPDDSFWRWRSFMAEKIAASIDPDRMGVKAVYLFGSTNNGTAGPGSDIDLMIHFVGNEQQKKDLMRWLEGWSLCLAQVNFLKTGYQSDGLLDVQLVSDEDFEKKTAFASKVGSLNDPARPLAMRETFF